MPYCYAYCHPVSKVPFYIGKGTGDRVQAHLTNCNNKNLGGYVCPFYRKLRKMFREGIKPQIVKVFEGSDRACLQTEMTLIQSYGRLCNGGTLYNLTDGGEGTLGRVCSDSNREAVAAANRNRRVSAETRKKMSNSAKARFSPASAKAFDLERRKSPSLETRKKMSLAKVK